MCNKEQRFEITTKVNEGFLKINYLRDKNHPNDNFKYEYINKKDATAIILFNYNYTKFYLVKQFRVGVMDEIWEIPAGILEDHLTPLENSLKELEEEVGYNKDDITNIIDLGSSYVSPGYSTEKIHYFSGRLKKDAVKKEKKLDENEIIIDEGFFSYKEAKEIGAFLDAKTLLAYELYRQIPKKKIGILGGTFNPVTNYHIRIMLHTINSLKLDKLYIEPVSDKYMYKDKTDILPVTHRINMLKLEVDRYEKIIIGNYDISNFNDKINRCPTIDTLNYYKEQYGDAEIYFICGSDNLKTVSSWIKSEEILSKYKIAVYARENENINNEIIAKDNLLLKYNKNIEIIHDNFVNNISSSMVRDYIKNKITTYGLISEKIEKYILEESLYL